MKIVSLLFFTAFLFTTQPSWSQHRPVQFGERPPIDLGLVSPEAFEPGQFRIRLTEAAGAQLDKSPIQQQQGVVVFGMDALDALSRDMAIHEVQPTFAHPVLKNQHSDRHRLWGLHLWYDVYTDEKQDIIALVQMFQALDEVAVAEPVYRKQMVSGEIFEWDEDAFIVPAEAEGWLPNDPQFGSQWHYVNTGQTNGTPGADISLQQAWAVEKGNPAVIVAIVDDGIQFNHPDLAANMWEGIGFNFVDNSASIVPGNHGTHVAGTVAAVSDNGVGVAGVAGGSGSGDGVRLMSAQVFRGNASGGFAVAPVWAADNGAAISQNSWGYTAPGVFEQAVLDAIDYFNVNGGGDVMEGGITIFAAGNSGDSGNYYPGFYAGAMSVASTNHNDQRSYYSTYGTWVDLSAPGGETINVNSQGVLSTVTGSGYAFYQGTSMACPHVSGTAALVLSYAPGVLTNQELWDILVNTTDYHYDVNPGYMGQLGSGRLNAFAALNEVDNYLSGLINPSSFSITGTATDQIDLSWIPNPDNDPVLLAYSTDGSFGIPQGTYQPGETISGGGQVLFAGHADSFQHTGLETATTYFYKIWSLKEGSYSSGRIGSGTTWCGEYELPFAETFASPAVPLCWEPGGWQVGSFSGGLNLPGNYAYSASGLTGGQNASLVTPIINMSGYEEITVSFQHYLRTFFLGGTSATFSYSIDGGLNWTAVQNWTSTTANPASYQVNLPELAGQPMVMFRWNISIGVIGYYWTVGNLSVTGTPLESTETFSAEFVVEDQSGTPLDGAAVTLNGVSFDEGEYLFEDLLPGDYDYVVFKDCYLVSEGVFSINGEDVLVEVVLANLQGDANNDGQVNVLDVIAIVEYFTNNVSGDFCFVNADINGDDVIDVIDIIGIVNLFAQGKS